MFCPFGHYKYIENILLRATLVGYRRTNFAQMFQKVNIED